MSVYRLDTFHRGPNPRPAPDGKWHVWDTQNGEHKGAFDSLQKAKAEVRRLNKGD